VRPSGRNEFARETSRLSRLSDPVQILDHEEQQALARPGAKEHAAIRGRERRMFPSRSGAQGIGTGMDLTGSFPLGQWAGWGGARDGD